MVAEAVVEQNGMFLVVSVTKNNVTEGGFVFNRTRKSLDTLRALLTHNKCVGIQFSGVTDAKDLFDRVAA